MRYIIVLQSTLFLLLLSFSLRPGLSTAAEVEGLNGRDEKSGYRGIINEWLGGFEYDIRALAFSTYQDMADSSQNPDNAFFAIPRHQTEIELRPDARLEWRWLDLSVKPRLNLEWSDWEDGPRDGDSDVDDDWFINEWLGRVRLTEGLFASYGRENLQWGPSYLISPSNPFFRDNGRRNPKREVGGMDFARLVWVPGMPWTLSFIANVDQGRQEFRFFDFEETYALKMDYTGYESYFSLILSRQVGDRPRLGAFGGWTATDALLLYGEGSFSQGTNALYPAEADNPFGISMETIKDDETSLKATLLLGGSYTLESGPTFAIEYLYNGPGYTDGEAEAYFGLRDKAADAFLLSSPVSDLARLTLSQTADPKLRLLRRNYIMFQYLHNDIQDVLNLTLRWTQNIDDGSGQFISIVDYYIGDHVQLFSIGTVNAGSGDTEFGSILDIQWMIGLEYFF